MSESKRIVVIGAGVIGLTTAYLLSEEYHAVTVIAKHMPGDYDVEYASPWAGASYWPVAKPNTPAQSYEKATWPHLSRLARDVPEAGVHFQDSVIYNRTKDAQTAVGRWASEKVKPDPWFKPLFPDFKNLSKDELPSETIDSATRFTAVGINSPMYLGWLASSCVRKGVHMRRGVLKHVSNAATLHHSGHKADVVVNCTGLSARTLGGVEDTTVIPARGQIVLVSNDPGYMVDMSGTDDGEDEACYVITRAAGGGTILGGCYQKGSWESQPDLNMANRIMRRCVEICPELTNGKGVDGLSIIRQGVGLRPLREQGPRVEREKIEGVDVVHQYGHGGYGYQASWGSAEAAVELIKEANGEKKERSRL